MDMTPRQLAKIAVNTNTYRQVIQHICDMTNVQLAFAEDGTVLVSNAPTPLLMTRDMGHALSGAVASDNWHLYSVAVRRTPEGLYTGDETLIDTGATQ